MRYFLSKAEVAFIQDGGCDAVPSVCPPPADVAVTLTTKAGAAILTPTPPVNRYAEMSDRKRGGMTGSRTTTAKRF